MIRQWRMSRLKESGGGRVVLSPFFHWTRVKGEGDGNGEGDWGRGLAVSGNIFEERVGRQVGRRGIRYLHRRSTKAKSRPVWDGFSQ